MQCRRGLLFPWQFQCVIREFKIYFVFKKFYTRYFDHILSSSPLLTQFHVLLSLSQTKTNSKQTTKDTKTKLKGYKNMKSALS